MKLSYPSEKSSEAKTKRFFTFLYAIISAFRSMDVKWNDDSLLHAAEKGDAEAVGKWLLTIRERLAGPDGKLN